MSESNRLNALTVKKLSEPGRYSDGGGLYLRVAEYETKAGAARSKNWLFRYERGGRERQMGLGSLTTLSLAQARVKALECRRALNDGIDPIEARRARRSAAALDSARGMTFQQCGEAFIKAHRDSWKNPVHAKQWPSTLQAYVYPKIGKLPVAGIDTELVLKCLEPIWEKVPDTANRVRGRIEKILDWAKARQFRHGENPARWKGHLDHLLAKPKAQRVKHHAAMPYKEIPKFMAELRGHEVISSRALEFLILTAARTGETIGAKRSEIDNSEKLWTVPAARMKSARAHIVPLPLRATEILATLPKVTDGGDLLFPGLRRGMPLSNMAMLELLRNMRPGLTVHGFRSTFRDWAGDCTNYQSDVIEAALAHIVVDETEAAYRRSTAVQKRRRLMADWAKFCQGAVEIDSSANVVAIGKRRSRSK